MAAAMSTRPVPAPDADWLTETEVLVLLGDLSSRTLDRYIQAGRFPRGVLWGSTAKWRWEDVAWFHLGQIVRPRLSNDDDGAQDEKPPTSKRQPSPPTT